MQKTGIKSKFDLGDRLVDFSVLVIDVVEALPDNRVGNHVAGQLLRAGTAPAPNHGEAQSAESRKDFVHKMKVALKELRETQVWLKIIKRKQLASVELVEKALTESNELIAIFVSSITTARRNMKDES
jgi:four helix bundle protein